MTRRTKKSIEIAIKQLGLKDSELKVIALGDMNKICTIAKCRLGDLMWYLRYEK